MNTWPSRLSLPILSLLLVCIAGLAQAAPQIGQPAPDFSGTDVDGKVWHLNDFRGQTLVLEWTNHDCPYVRKHYGSGNMQALQGAAAKDGVVWLSIISSAPGKQGHVTPAEAKELTSSRHAAPTSVILDPSGEIGRAYEAKTTPHMFVIDPKGLLVYMGGIDDKATTDQADIPGARNHVAAALAELKAGKAVSQPITKPYGCSVKY